MYDIFFKDIEASFNLEKLKKDLFNYLGDDYQITSSHEISGTEKKNILEKDDVFTIGAIRIIKRYENQNFLPYTIELIIGEYNNSLGVILVEKFVAEMSYNFNYELITVDFIHNLETEQ